MVKQRRGEVNTFANRGTLFFAIATSVWSLCLLAGGAWWFIQHSTNRLISTEQPSTSNQPQRFTQIQDVPTGLFRYGGSAAWAPIRLAVDTVIQSQRREFQLRYVQPDSSEVIGSKSGIEMLLEGKLDIAQSTQPPSTEQQQKAVGQNATLVQVPIAMDGITIAAHPQLDMPGLTISQLRSIYQGEVLNWRQLGGPDLSIQPYSRPLNAGGLVETFAEKILEGKVFGGNVTFVSTTTEALRKLANIPGSLYYASAPELVPQCTIQTLPLGQESNQLIPPYQPPLIPESDCPYVRNQVNITAIQKQQYPLTHFLYVIYKESSKGESAGAAYANFLLTSQGQKLIQNAGFSPVDSRDREKAND